VFAASKYRRRPSCCEHMPNTENRTVQNLSEPLAPPLRRRNAELRPREYLTAAEVETLIIAALKRRRYGHRDATMMLLASRQRLRLSELITLRWDQMDLVTVEATTRTAMRWSKRSAGCRHHYHRERSGSFNEELSPHQPAITAPVT